MSPYRMSKIERAPRLVLEFNQARNRHDVAAMVKLISDDCVLEPADPAPDGTVYTGKQAIAQYWHDFFRQSPLVGADLDVTRSRDTGRAVKL